MMRQKIKTPFYINKSKPYPWLPLVGVLCLVPRVGEIRSSISIGRGRARETYKYNDVSCARHQSTFGVQNSSSSSTLQQETTDNQI